MKVLNYGSLNYDHIYVMDHFVMPKETESSNSYTKGFGGKGLNQSIALSKAGVEVYHAGKIGNDGQDFIDYLHKYNVKTDYLIKDDAIATGHAIIQVADSQNCIILHGGGNQLINEKEIDETLTHFTSDDVLLLQNEISCMPYIIKKAHDIGMKIVFNTAPMNDAVFTYPLDLVDMFVVNEIEGAGLAKTNSSDIDDIINGLVKAYPNKEIILTVGEKGSYYICGNELIHQEAYVTKAIDTTAAGDTFTGYYLAAILNGKTVPEALKLASKASSIAVSRFGAAPSIPELIEVETLND